MNRSEITRLIDADLHQNPINKDHCSCKMPSNREVKRILSLTKELVFPGYFGPHKTKETLTKSQTKRIVNRLYRRMYRQISFALLYTTDNRKKNDFAKIVEEHTYAYLAMIPELRRALRTDLEAHFEGDPAAYNRDQIIVSYPGFYAIGVYRMAHILYERHIPLIARMMTEFVHRETGIDIHPGATIGDYFMIDHGTGVVIGETTHIGHHVKLYQGVTLGALSTKGGQALKTIKRHPTIGNYVTIYAGASILGGTTEIGDHATIGSNAFITQSIEAHQRVSNKPKNT